MSPLRVGIDQLILALKERLGELIDDLLAQIGGGGNNCSNGHRTDVLGDAAIGAGRNIVLKQERILLIEPVDLILIERDHAELVRGGQLDKARGGRARDGEACRRFAVLDAFRGEGERAVDRINVVKGHAIGLENLAGVDLGAGADVANHDGLAAQVFNAGDTGLGKELDVLGIHADHPKRGILHAGFREGIAALVGIGQHVGLKNCHLRFAVRDHVDVGLGGAGGLNGDIGKRELIVQNGGDGAADRVISTGGAAGGKNDTGFLRRGVAVIRCRAIVVGLPAAGGEGEDHQHGKHKSEKLFHAQTPYIC